MLVLANGAFKSGSTWLYVTVQRLTGFPPTPDEYRNPNWRNHSIAPKKLEDALANLDYHTDNYIVKTHFGKPEERDLILSYDDVYVLNIKRDIRDVVVSAYYHEVRSYNYEGSFEEFYWLRGKKVAQQVIDYHAVWSVQSPRITTASYERMLEDFRKEFRQVSAFLGFHPTDETIEEIRAFFQIERIRELWKEENERISFFRKGVAGDWRKHFTPDTQADFERWLGIRR
ncbi:MAG: sulfotransferase domain-containing protein [Gammaproteobacteria bacterium]